MSAPQKGRLVVISGPAGSGKGTVVTNLRGIGSYGYSVSATTRPPRAGERDGVEYFFLTQEQFREKIDRGEMLEYNFYSGNYYGTPLRSVLDQLDAGMNVILEIDVNGGMNAKRVYPETVLVMLTPPDYPTLEARLRGRGTNTEEDIRVRLGESERELRCLRDYNALVVSYDGESEKAAREIDAFLRSEAPEKASVENADEFIRQFFAEKSEKRGINE